MTLTARTALIKLKVGLCTIIFILAIALTTLKAYILTTNKDSQENVNKDWVEARLGVKNDKPVATLFPDTFMIVASVALFMHYIS